MKIECALWERERMGGVRIGEVSDAIISDSLDDECNTAQRRVQAEQAVLAYQAFVNCIVFDLNLKVAEYRYDIRLTFAEIRIRSRLCSNPLVKPIGVRWHPIRSDTLSFNLCANVTRIVPVFLDGYEGTPERRK